MHSVKNETVFAVQSVKIETGFSVGLRLSAGRQVSNEPMEFEELTI